METQMELKTKHTYLFEEGTWSAHGNYFDAENNDMEVKGESRIKHEKDQWHINSFMELQDAAKTRIKSTYVISAMSSSDEYSFWESDNPDLGKLLGRFMIVGDSIMSMYQSESRLYSGTEVLTKISDRKYLSKGFAFYGDEKLSSWEVTLEKVK